MLPVEIGAMAAASGLEAGRPSRRRRADADESGVIEIELGSGSRVRVDVDADALRRVPSVLGER